MRYDDELQVTGPKGSVMITNGALWHASSANRTDRERVCLLGFFCRAFLKPQQDQIRIVSDEVVARHPHPEAPARLRLQAEHARLSGHVQRSRRSPPMRSKCRVLPVTRSEPCTSVVAAMNRSASGRSIEARDSSVLS